MHELSTWFAALGGEMWLGFPRVPGVQVFRRCRLRLCYGIGKAGGAAAMWRIGDMACIANCLVSEMLGVQEWRIVRVALC